MRMNLSHIRTMQLLNLCCQVLTTTLVNYTRSKTNLDTLTSRPSRCLTISRTCIRTKVKCTNRVHKIWVRNVITICRRWIPQWSKTLLSLCNSLLSNFPSSRWAINNLSLQWVMNSNNSLMFSTKTCQWLATMFFLQNKWHINSSSHFCIRYKLIKTKC